VTAFNSAADCHQPESKMGLDYASTAYGILFDYPLTTCGDLVNSDLAGIGVRFLIADAVSAR
jgi:hypothetical protein